MRHDVEHQIAVLARQQHGVVTRAQLLGLGLSSSAVQRRVESGRLLRLHRGVYLVGPIEPPHAPEMAAVLACGSAAVVSHRSAAGLLTLTTRDGGRRSDATNRSVVATDRPADISVVGGHNGPRSGIRVHRIGRLHPDERWVHHGIPVTSPARTILDLAGMTTREDDPGGVTVRELERALARAERERLIRPGELEALLSRHDRRPGTPVLRELLGQRHGPALTRSEAESRFLALVRGAGLPPPGVNVRLHGYEIDFFWRKHAVAVEVDGYRYHGVRARFESDRERITRLAAHGIQTIPVTWRQIVDEGPATAVRLSRALLHAELRR